MKVVIFCLLIITLSSISYAENITYKDISIQTNLPDNISINKSYENLFRITNNDHIPGHSDEISVTAVYTLKEPNKTLKNDTFSVIVNAYKTSGTGSFFLNSSGNFSLCGQIINSSHPDNCTSNNINCTSFSIPIIKNANTSNHTNASKDYCNISISIEAAKSIYENHEKISFQNILSNSSSNFTIEYWIEDLFGNIIKKRYNTTNLGTKSYTPDIDSEEKTLIVKNRLYINCNNTGTPESSKHLTVRNNITRPSESSITISSVSQDTRFGESAIIGIDAYKGDTRKTVIYIWVEDSEGEKFSEKSKVYLDEKYSYSSFRLPVQLEPDCENKNEEGEYYIIAEGLSTSSQETIYLSGNDDGLCFREYIEKSETKSPAPTQEKREEGMSYSFHKIPQTMRANESFTISINLTNQDPRPHNLSVWSYLYSGPICYSINRTFNRVDTYLPAKSSIILPMILTNNRTSPGNYRIKAKIRKDAQKTEKELTKEINLIQPIIPVRETPTTKQKNNHTTILPTAMVISNISEKETVFTEDTQEIMAFLPFAIILISILCVFLYFKKIKKPDPKPKEN